MEQTQPGIVEHLEAEREHAVEQLLQDNRDLPARLLSEEVAVAFDVGQDLLALTIGEPGDAVSLTVDGELYLRTDIDTNKLLSGELYYFTQHLKRQTPAFRVMECLLRMVRTCRPLSVALIAPIEGEAVELERQVSVGQFVHALFPTVKGDGLMEGLETSLLALAGKREQPTPNPPAH